MDLKASEQAFAVAKLNEAESEGGPETRDGRGRQLRQDVEFAGKSALSSEAE
ncbi:MAG: hypothetical protein ACPLSY_02000 [Moorellaceae bacterium]